MAVAVVAVLRHWMYAGDLVRGLLRRATLRMEDEDAAQLLSRHG
jgi:hypothetical protein